MTYRPFEDPRRFLGGRLEQLDEQLAGGRLGARVLGELTGLQERFHDNTVSAEAICRSAIRLYWANQDAVHGTPAGSNLATLAHDFGAYANVDIEVLERHWMAAQTAAAG